MTNKTPLAEIDSAGLRLIVADLVTSAQAISNEWALAVAAEGLGDYDQSMTHLGNVVGQLIAGPSQADDIGKAAYEALEALEKLTAGAE
ncbi:MAG: hypothetical protein M3P52_02685 [Actinomycetota bacterium]|nr:hypothetical protein [Actinomycetota bacterium]